MGASARPVYALKERRQCAYCHLNPKGGGPRNPRGLYYAAHKYSFADYDEKKVMGEVPPLFHGEWQETMGANVYKIGVGDTTGDGTQRLITLSAGSGRRNRTITVKKWDGKAWIDEFSAETGDDSDRLAVGRYGTGKAAVIVTSPTLFFWNGQTYDRRPAPRKLPIIGTVTMRDGSDRLILREGDTIKLHRVNTAASGTEWLSQGMDAPPSAETIFTDMKGGSTELQSIGLPPLLAAGGVVGLWDARKSNLLFLYGVQLVALVEGDAQDGKTQAAKPEQLTLRGREVYLTIVDPRRAAIRTLWHSDKLKGTVLDATLTDPRKGEAGILVLTDGSDDGKGHTLTFFKLD